MSVSLSQLRYCFQSPQDAPALARFADRLEGTPYRTWPLQVEWSQPLQGMPADDTFPVRRRRLLLYEGEEIRALQNFFEHELYTRGEPHRFVWPNGPLSEGVVDRRFGMCWPILLQHSLQLQPLHLAVGGTPQTQAVWTGFGWSRTVPMRRFLLPLRAARALREMDVFRRTLGRRLIASGLAATGLGSALAFLAGGGRRRRPDSDVTWQEHPEFGPWADEVWSGAIASYAAVTRRDAATLNRLYRPGDDRFHRFVVRRNGRAIGWFLYTAALRPSSEMNLGFGRARVAALVDGFASPDDAGRVLRAARRRFEDEGVDVAFGNWSHVAWQRACTDAGFWPGVSENWVVVSKAGRSLFQSAEDVASAHFSEGDCDGPYYVAPPRDEPVAGARAGQANPIPR